MPGYRQSRKKLLHSRCRASVLHIMIDNQQSCLLSMTSPNSMFNISKQKPLETPAGTVLLPQWRPTDSSKAATSVIETPFLEHVPAPSSNNSNEDTPSSLHNPGSHRTTAFTPAMNTALEQAGLRTQFVDTYFIENFGAHPLFSEVYFAHGQRSIEVVEGDQLTAFKCLVGCVHPQGRLTWPIPQQQKCQAISDHIFTRTHCSNCKPPMVTTPVEMTAYWQEVKEANPRTARWANGMKNSSRSKKRLAIASASKKRKKTSKAKDDSIYLIPGSIAAHALNGLGQPGAGKTQEMQDAMRQQGGRPTRTR